MPKSTARAAVLTAVLALTLTGCAGTTEPPADEPQESSQASETPAAPATVEPSDPEATDAEEWFLTETAIAKVDLSDEEKLAAGYYACEEVAAGNLDVVAVEGLEEGLNEWIVADAAATLCPELSQTVIDHQSQN